MKYQPTLDSYERCETAEERACWAALKYPLELSATLDSHATAEQLAYHRAHLARIRLIYTPFPVVRRIGAAGSAMTWAGTIVGDSMSSASLRALSKAHGGYTRHAGLGDTQYGRVAEGD